jgi:hypothetical protein
MMALGILPYNIISTGLSISALSFLCRITKII